MSWPRLHTEAVWYSVTLVGGASASLLDPLLDTEILLSVNTWDMPTSPPATPPTLATLATLCCLRLAPPLEEMEARDWDDIVLAPIVGRTGIESVVYSTV